MKGYWREIGCNEQSLHNTCLALARRQIAVKKTSEIVESGDEMADILSELILGDNIPTVLRHRVSTTVMRWQNATK